MKRFLGSAAVAAVSLAVALALGEFVVRALMKDETVMFPRYHTDYRYGDYTIRGIRPHARFWHTSVDGHWKFVTNGRGLRDTREFPYAKPAGTLRVLALGDSHTQGYEVRQDQTFSAVLERALGAHGIKAEVLNAGVSGFSTAEELVYLEAEGYKYQPDVVVLAFFANDYEDNLKAGLFSLDSGKLVARSHEHIPGVRIQNAIYAVPGVQWLSENSYFYSFAFNTVWTRAKSMLAAHAREEAFDYAVATKTQSKYDTELAVALIERAQAFCDSHGMRLIVVDVPQAISPYKWKESITLAKPGLEFVSSKDLLKPYEGAVEAHLPHGHNHISEFTHALIGAELARRIMEKK